MATVHASANASNAPAPVPAPLVFRTAKNKGYRYHNVQGCSNAEVSLSLPEADRLRLTPCRKCAQVVVS
jgi:hypothetical protein